MTTTRCRFCKEMIHDTFVNLANCPPSNSFLTADQLNEPETYYPLAAYVCGNCHLVQLDEFKKARDIFNNEYAYFSSCSKSWVEHARCYVEEVVARFGYDQQSYIIEIASNDGYLLQHFTAKGIPVLGIEPSANTAAAAIQKGIPTIVNYFDSNLARSLSRNQKGDLIIGNNVLAHVPDINDFVEGVKTILKDGGVVTMEFPHLLRLVQECQFDTIYHEHFSYLSLTTTKRIFDTHSLEIFDVREVPTHGGSLRIFARHREDHSKHVKASVQEILDKEKAAGLTTREFYLDFQRRVDLIKCEFLRFLITQRAAGKKVIGYGAAAKGNTLLNYSGIKGTDFIQFVVDAAPSKQGKFLPGSHIPVYDESLIRTYRPDYIIILPWNLEGEITEQLSYVAEWGCQFVVFVPHVRILPRDGLAPDLRLPSDSRAYLIERTLFPSEWN